MPDLVYLDHNATTPLADEVLEAMIAPLRSAWGNPSSAHVLGPPARRVIDRAREQVAALLGCSPDEIVFTSGGTESDNAAVEGVAEALAERGRHLVISSIEHAAVERSAARLERRGYEVTRVGVGADGRVDPQELSAALRADTVLVSVMHANNETGVLQPIAEIAAAARERGIPVHTDAAQSVGKIRALVDELGVDLLTVAGHKLYGPKGVGALYVRRGTPLAPFLVGAGHEGGRRAGTENTAGIVGLGAACELALRDLEPREAHLRAMRDRLEARLRERIGGLIVHGAAAPRLPNTASVGFPGVDGPAILESLEDRVAASAGAACHGRSRTPSRVLLAMGVSTEAAVGTLRLSVGRSTAADEVDRAARLLAGAWSRLGAIRT